MRTTLVVIFLVRVEQMAEMLLAKDHDVIEAVPPDRSDQPLRESICRECTDFFRESYNHTTTRHCIISCNPALVFGMGIAHNGVERRRKHELRSEDAKGKS